MAEGSAKCVRIMSSEMSQSLIKIEWKVFPFVYPFVYTSGVFIADDSHEIFKHVKVQLKTNPKGGTHMLTAYFTRHDKGQIPLFIHNLQVVINGPECFHHIFKRTYDAELNVRP